MSKEIPLTQNLYAIIDDEDYERINKYRWCASGNHASGIYAVTVIDKQYVGMHRFLLQPNLGQDVDHRNRKTLDNRKSNLRICSRSQNNGNSISKGGISKYKGVSYNSLRNKWRATIVKDKRQYCLGYYMEEIDAVKAYDAAARIIFKEFALTNFIDNIETINNIREKERIKTKKTSKYRGVYLMNNTNKWVASISIANTNKYLGSFSSELDAARAYDKAAIAAGRKTYLLNFQDEI